MKKFFKSFTYAFTGLRLAAQRGINFNIQVGIAIAVLIASIALNLSQVELSVVILAIAAVLCAESFNTALEELCDKFSPTHDPHIGRIKDLAAAAVLIISLGALFIGIVIFSNHL